ncbi:putative peroxidase-related enzyme [Leisingera aquaemixtae]|uniref:Putative peroxidase-related enzyme n=1 Tax=Leisingera aquaemixtae TaxID=1396826 RepID=A0A0P1H951_9RHOB|nr:putative peroxidase-related enzyme [Leisingera aquaemixtae]
MLAGFSIAGRAGALTEGSPAASLGSIQGGRTDVASFSGIEKDSGLTHVLSSFPRNAEQLLHLLDSIMCGSGALSRGEREAIAAYVSGLNDVAYCVHYHSLFSDVFCGPVAATQDRIRPLLEYARALHGGEAEGLSQAFEEAVTAGWSEAALYEVVEVCGVFSFINTIVKAAGLAEPGQAPEPRPTAQELVNSYAAMAQAVRGK